MKTPNNIVDKTLSGEKITTPDQLSAEDKETNQRRRPDTQFKQQAHSKEFFQKLQPKENSMVDCSRRIMRGLEGRRKPDKQERHRTPLQKLPSSVASTHLKTSIC